MGEKKPSIDRKVPIVKLYASPVISAVQSLFILNSSKPGSLPISKPFSFAKCNKQMKQYDVEISLMACGGYADVRLLTILVNFRGSCWSCDIGEDVDCWLGLVASGNDS